MTSRDQFEKNKKRLEELEKLKSPLFKESNKIERNQEVLMAKILFEEQILRRYVWKYIHTEYSSWVIKCTSDTGHDLDFLGLWPHGSIYLTKHISLVNSDSDLYISIDSDCTKKELMDFFKKSNLVGMIDFNELTKSIESKEQEVNKLKSVRDNLEDIFASIGRKK